MSSLCPKVKFKQSKTAKWIREFGGRFFRVTCWRQIRRNWPPFRGIFKPEYILKEGQKGCLIITISTVNKMAPSDQDLKLSGLRFTQFKKGNFCRRNFGFLLLHFRNSYICFVALKKMDFEVDRWFQYQNEISLQTCQTKGEGGGGGSPVLKNHL